MSFNGVGVFLRLYSWVNDAANSINITASRMDAETDGIATGLSNCITKDGQQTITANIPFNNNKITGLRDGTALTDAANLHVVQDQQLTWGGTSAGSANAQTINTSPVTTAYVAGQEYQFIAGFSNTGAMTLAVNGLAAKAVQSGAAALSGGEIVAGKTYSVIYDGSAFQFPGGAYLPLAGGTLTGGLTITPASGSAIVTLDTPTPQNRVLRAATNGLSRWSMYIATGTAEGGANAGSDFQLQRFNDAGAPIDTPLSITRASGNMTIASAQIIQSTTAPSFVMTCPAGNGRTIWGQTAGSTRWQVQVGNGVAESGSNNGSDFSINGFTDAGALVNTAISIKRSTGVVTFAVAIVNGPSDRSLKENIAPLEGSLAKVVQLQGVSFNMIGDPEARPQIGLIAQDVAPIVPEVIQTYQTGIEGEPDKLALDYPKLVAHLIEAIKELTARVATLEAGSTPR